MISGIANRYEAMNCLDLSISIAVLPTEYLCYFRITAYMDIAWLSFTSQTFQLTHMHSKGVCR